MLNLRVSRAAYARRYAALLPYLQNPGKYKNARMKQLIRLVIASALLVSVSYNLLGQKVAPPSARRTQTGDHSKNVTRLVGYNESGVVAVLHTIVNAEGTYQATDGYGGFGSLEQLGDAKLIDSLLAEGHRYGYLFKLKVEKGSTESPPSFHAVAVPRSYGRTGVRSFYIDQTGVLRGADKRGEESTVDDEPLDQ
jgi:hypothetical protein